MFSKKIAAALIILASTSAFAEDGCKIVVTRTPCPGDKIRAEALGPYGMKETKEWGEAKKAKTKDECIAKTTEAATIQRPLFVKKVAVGSWDGTEVKTETKEAKVESCKKEK